MIGVNDLARVSQELGVPYSGPSVALGGLAIDSRKVQAGDLFVAAKGAQADGHDYVEAAAAAGASAAMVERPVSASIPCIEVPNTLRAISKVGKLNRDAFVGPVIAITGSCGKTSVKNMCRAVFEQSGDTVATVGNLNNEIGVPMTLSRIDDDTRFAVVEMGAAGRGHIAHLCDLARPGISTVLNATEAHLEGFGSVADVADIKAEIFDQLGSSGVGVVNLDQPWSATWSNRVASAGAACLDFSAEQHADVYATEVAADGPACMCFRLHWDGHSEEVSLPVPGSHSVSNALATAALALAAGLSFDEVVTGLSRVEGEAGRLQVSELPGRVKLVDDSYNANPGSVRVAIRYLAANYQRPALILGEMLELGSESEALHAEMGQLASQAGITRFIGVGAMLAPAVTSFGAGAELCETQEAIDGLLAGLLEDCDAVLVKGSRGAAMENVVARIRKFAKGRG
ncbi:MAG: UDP-N-acetylmuramoyl-tripeptide--D-alanyl-D-alanine ligase [Pseudomonadota bacterium]